VSSVLMSKFPLGNLKRGPLVDEQGYECVFGKEA